MMEDDDLGPILAAAAVRARFHLPTFSRGCCRMPMMHSRSKPRVLPVEPALPSPARHDARASGRLCRHDRRQWRLCRAWTATIAGLWLGYADPVGLEWLTGTLMPAIAGEVDLLQADDLFFWRGLKMTEPVPPVAQGPANTPRRTVSCWSSLWRLTLLIAGLAVGAVLRDGPARGAAISDLGR